MPGVKLSRELAERVKRSTIYVEGLAKTGNTNPPNTANPRRQARWYMATDDPPPPMMDGGLASAMCTLLKFDDETETLVETSTVEKVWSNQTIPTGDPFQAHNIGGRPFAITQSDIFRVKMTQTGGDDGTSTSMNTWVYSVFDKSGMETLASGITLPFGGTTHDYMTWELGEVKPATKGLAYYREGSLIICDCNEKLRLGECVDAGGGDPGKCPDPIGPTKKKCKSEPLTEGQSSAFNVMFSDPTGAFTVAAKTPRLGEFIKISITVDGKPDFQGFVPSRGGRVYHRVGTTVTARTEIHSPGSQPRSLATFGIGQASLVESCGCSPPPIVTEFPRSAVEVEPVVSAVITASDSLAYSQIRSIVSLRV